MPASLYRLAGRDHHTVSVESSPQESVAEAHIDQIVEAASNSQTVENDLQPIVIVPEVTVQPVIQTAEIKVEPVAETSKMPKQTWDSSMSRTQLAKVASSLGLTFTDKSTKAEIISLLESASKI